MARNRKHIYKHFIYHINNINTTRLEKIFIKYFSQLKNSVSIIVYMNLYLFIKWIVVTI